jgi:uncharacterized protein
MNEIRVERPSEAQLGELGVEGWSSWSCGVSTFEWTYDAEETAYVREGHVRVHLPAGETVEIRAGDLVTFPAGLSCTWEVVEPIRKVYTFEEIR